MRDILIDFKKRINSKGLISQTDVLSLESLIGENVITDHKSINYFTKDSTQVGLQEVNNIIDNKINEQEVNNQMTVQDFLKLSEQITNRIKWFKEFIFDKIVALPQSIIDYVNDPKYTKIFINNTNGSQEIADARDEYLYNILIYNKPYVYKLLEVANIEQDEYEKTLDKIKELEIKPEDTYYVNYFNAALGTIEPLTFNLLFKIKDNIKTIEDTLDNDLSYVKDYSNLDTIENFLIHFNSENTKSVIKTFQDLNAKYEDSKANTFLNLILILFKNEK